MTPSRLSFSLDEETKQDLTQLKELLERKLGGTKLSLATVVRLAIHKAAVAENADRYC